MQISQQLVQNFIKTLSKSETADCLLKFKKNNDEPSQCITKFTTNDRQYS